PAGASATPFDEEAWRWEIARDTLREAQCSCSPLALESGPTGDSSASRPMAIVALKQKPTLKAFHATFHVTRVEQLCVEAETAEEARELLAAGAGHRCEIGDCVNVEVGHVED